MPVSIRRAIFRNVCRASQTPPRWGVKTHRRHGLWQTSSCEVRSRQTPRFDRPIADDLHHCYRDCGTCGPLGAGAGLDGAGAGLDGAGAADDGPGAAGPPAGGVLPPPSVPSKPPLPEFNGATGGGAPGAWRAGALPGISDTGAPLCAAKSDRIRLVRKNPAARSAVVRVSTFAVPRPVMKPLVVLTSPPPSDFCSKTTPIRARTSIRWIAITTLSIGKSAIGRGSAISCRPPAVPDIGYCRALYTTRSGFSMAGLRWLKFVPFPAARGAGKAG